MSIKEATWRFFTAPFVAVWSVLTSIASLSRRQVRSLVTVGFLGGMVSLSVENWFITFYLDGVVFDQSIDYEEKKSFIGFMLDRMRNTSILQGLITVALMTVILNADRLSVKGAGGEIKIGGDDI